MTLERAVFFRRLLSVGQTDTYVKSIEQALEQEESLSDLLLELAFCLSDIDKTISLLDHYISEREADEFVLYKMLLSEFRLLYSSGVLSLQKTAESLLYIHESNYLHCSKAWRDITHLSYVYDEVKDGYWDEKWFWDMFLEVLFPEKKAEVV